MQSQALLYGARHLAVILVLARHQRLHDLAAQARARMEVQAVRTAERRMRSLSRFTSALPGILNSVRTFRTTSAGLMARNFGRSREGSSQQRRLSTMSSVGGLDAPQLKSTISTTMQRVIDSTHTTPAVLTTPWGTAAASRPSGPVAEAIVSTTFEKRGVEAARQGADSAPPDPEPAPPEEQCPAAPTQVCEPTVPAVSSVVQVEELTVNAEGEVRPAMPAVAGQLPTLSDLLPRERSRSLTDAVQQSTRSVLSQLSLGEGICRDVRALTAPAPVTARPLPIASPRAEFGRDESIWAQFCRCRLRMREAVSALPLVPDEVPQPGMSVAILQRRLARMPVPFLRSALNAALAAETSWQHHSGLRLLRDGAIYGLVTSTGHSGWPRGSADGLQEGAEPPSLWDAGARLAAGEVTVGGAEELETAAAAAASAAAPGKWAKVKGRQVAMAAGDADGGSGRGGRLGNSAWLRATTSGQSPLSKAGGKSLRQQLFDVINASKTDAVLLAQKPLEGAWSRV